MKFRERGSTTYKLETYPNPDNTNPSTRDGPDVGEAPVGICGDDRRHELGDTERAEESGRRTLHEEEPMRTGDENEGLGDDSDLQVDNHVELRVVRFGGSCLESDTKFVLEEVGFHDDDDQSNAKGDVNMRKSSK